LFAPTPIVWDFTRTNAPPYPDAQGFVALSDLIETHTSERLRQTGRETKKSELIRRVLRFIEDIIEKARAMGEEPPPDREINRKAAAQVKRLNHEDYADMFKPENDKALLADIRRWRRNARKERPGT